MKNKAHMCIIISEGTSHDLMALIEIESELKGHLEPSKQNAEERIDELSVIVRETTQTLSEWGSHTEQSVSELHRARDEQVSCKQGINNIFLFLDSKLFH